MGALRVGPALTGALYLLLVGSAALALWVRQVPGALPPKLEVAAPWVFLAFAIGFAAYRLALVRAKKYPAAKALFQIGATVLFFMLLLPSSKGRFAEPADPLEVLLVDRNPEVRALAAEVSRHRMDGEKYLPRLAQALRDPSPEVRREAHRSLVALTGVDLGPPEDERAVEAWNERYR